jgi:hypothetical protein
MTHDELLIHLMVLKPEETIETRAVKLNNAIRALVELHKPRPMAVGLICCEECSKKIFNLYPCDTIQAIEKALA